MILKNSILYYVTVERGIQAKCTSTTREVQTGVFTKTAETMTSVEMKDAQTQKKLRKPKVSHFTHQFSGLKRSQAVQVERKMVSTASQWSDGEHSQAVKKNKKLAKVSFLATVSKFLH